MLDFTLVLAAYGAVLSTIVFVWTVLLSRRWFRVSVVFGIDSAEGETVSGLHISVQNRSDKTVFPRYLGLLYPYKKASVIDALWHLVQFRKWPRRIGWVHASLSHKEIEVHLPETIEPGDSFGTLIPEGPLLELTKDRASDRLVFYVQDAFGVNTYSPSFAFSEYEPGKIGA